MTEKNYKILRTALHKLPEYLPGEELWENMEKSLHVKSIIGIQKLSKIEPPQSIWQRIDKELAIRDKYAKIKLWAKWSLASAAILVLGAVIVVAVQSNHKHLAYSEELLLNEDVTRWQDDDAVVAQTLSLICEAKPEVCRSTEFKKMKKELEFLDQSKQAVVKQLNQYNKDPELKIKLTKIELEQTEIINQMVAIVN